MEFGRTVTGLIVLWEHIQYNLFRMLIRCKIAGMSRTGPCNYCTDSSERPIYKTKQHTIHYYQQLLCNQSRHLI